MSCSSDQKIVEKCDKTGKVVLFYDDFSKGFNPADPNSLYEFFSVTGPGFSFTSNDGVAISNNNGLTISSVPFKFTNPTKLDTIKYFAIIKNAPSVPFEGEYVYEAIMSSQQTGLNNLPQTLQATGGSLYGVNNANSDFRLALGILTMQSLDQIQFSCILTNEDIYAYYGLEPFGMTAYGGTEPNYNAWSHCIPIRKRNVQDPLNDFVKVAIAYNYKENYARWLINDIELFRVNRIGFPLERKYRIFEANGLAGDEFPNSLKRPTSFLLAFGTGNTMYGYNPQNPGQLPNIGLVRLLNAYTVDPIVTDPFGGSLPANYILDYFSTGFTGTNFGQGDILKLKYNSVYILAPERICRTFPDLYCCKKKLLLSRCQQDAINGVNSSDSLFLYKCKGCIKNCDECNKKSCEKCKKNICNNYDLSKIPTL